IRQGANVLGSGIDTRCDNKGYLVLPPSVHPSGGHYQWLVDTPPVALPDWIEGRLKKAETVKDHFSGPLATTAPFRSRASDLSRLRGLCSAVASTDPGSRNDVLNWASFRARELALDPAVVVRALTEAGLQ